VATVDYDYSKAYGGAGDTSVVSSAGGTMGDTTRQSAGDVAAVAAARAALGASFDSDVGGRGGGGGAAGAAVYREDSNVKEEIIEIDAPAGKLGVVIDTPDDGAPVVHAVKDSSVIADQICVGDKLIAVDDEDVRSMTAIKVSKLISKKSANPSRKLTIVRTTYIDDP
jgi:PDZ domain